MNLQINANLTVSLQARSTFEDDKKVFAQYQAMIKDDTGNWVLDPSNSTPQVVQVADKTNFDVYVNSSNADQLGQCATAIGNSLQPA